MKVWTIITVLLGQLFLSTFPKVAAEPTKLLIAHGAISNNVEPLLIAKEQGIFSKYGIEAELVFLHRLRAARCKQCWLVRFRSEWSGQRMLVQRKHRGR